jgi:integrase
MNATITTIPVPPGPPRPSGPESQGEFWKVYPHTDGGFELSVWVATGVRRKCRIPRQYGTREERARFARGAAAEMKRQHKTALTAPKPDPAKPDATRLTFGDVADLWTSGDLAKRYPDHVGKKKSAETDAKRLGFIKEQIGTIPIAEFKVQDAERVMRSLPERCKTPATRRHYAQIVSRVLSLACYPLRLIDRSPLPRGFLPKAGNLKAKVFLYPSEDAQLMACKEVPLVFRVLYGTLDREGMREGEALALRWRDVDLQRGVITLDRNKTDDPRAWALDPGVTRALVAWKERQAPRDPDGLASTDEAKRDAFEKERIFVDENGGSFEDVPFARLFRERHLKDAHIDRPELFVRSETRLPIRVHDLRATFVTIALALGKTEAWVTDRTGHKSSSMIYRYKRAARQVAELGLGGLTPLDQAIPELAPAKGSNVPPGGNDDSSRRAPPDAVEASSADGEVSREVSRKAVHGRGVEPLCLSAVEPKSTASASFATRALSLWGNPWGN